MLLFKNWRKVIPQTLATVSVSISIFCLGFDQGWSSPAIPSLQQEQPFNATKEELDWITSLTPIGSLVGAFLSAPLITFLGRRGTLLLIAPVYVGSYLLIALACNTDMIFAGRFIAGTLCGIASPAAQIYVGEISSPSIRGALSSVTGVFLMIGILIAYAFGSFLNWSKLTFFAITFPTLLGITAFFIPESPSWLLCKQKDGEARKSLQTLRGCNSDISKEFEIKKESSERIQNMPKVTIRNVTDPTFWKPLALCSMLMFFQQLSGNLAVVFNTNAIFESTGSALSSTISSVIVGVVMVAGTILSMFIIDKAGRKILLIISAIGMAISQAVLGGFFYMQAFQSQEFVESISWLPLTTLIIFFIFYSIGYNGIPFIILGELFPLRYRGVCGSLSGAVNRLFAFIIVRSYPALKDGLGNYGCFWFYSAWCCINVVCVIILLPETKGKSLEEIEKLFEIQKPLERVSVTGVQNKAYSSEENVNVPA